MQVPTRLCVIKGKNTHQSKSGRVGSNNKKETMNKTVITKSIIIALLALFGALNLSAQIALQNCVEVKALQGAANTELLYKIYVSSGQNTLEVLTYGGSGDCDVYVKLGSRPTTSNYNGKSVNLGTNERVAIDNPASGTWYVTVRGFKAFSRVSLKASYYEIRPGDLFLYTGASWISSRIIEFEASQLGLNNVKYSHAGIYLGKNAQNVPQVAEALGDPLSPLSNGVKVNRLQDSVKDAVRVDVRRHRQIGTKGSTVAAKARSYTAPYGFQQIGVLLKVALTPGDFAGIQALALAADITAGGKKKMICSELCAHAFNDAGIAPRVSPWHALVFSRVWTTPQRQRDYTTPNMLFLSPDLQQVGQIR
jgi:hypothetical protein